MPLHDSDARGPYAALSDSKQRPHFQIGDLLGIEDFDLYAYIFQIARTLGEFDGAQHVGWLIDEIAGDYDSVGDRFIADKRRARFFWTGAVDDELI